MPNYLVPAVLCTVLTLVGLVAVTYAVLSKRKLAVGDIDGALRASQTARSWCWVSLIVFLTVLLLVVTGVMQMPELRR